MEIIDRLGKIGKLDAVSTLYKKFRTTRSEDLNSSLTLVARWTVGLSAEEIFNVLSEMRLENSWHNGDDVTLLGIADEVRLVPGENLPNPALHGDSVILRCAAEVYGDYFHPVLGQTLTELVLCSDPASNAEFFSQGRSIFAGGKP